MEPNRPPQQSNSQSPVLPTAVSNPQPQPATQNNPLNEGNKLPGAFSLFKPSWEAVKLNLSTFLSLIIVPFILQLGYTAYIFAHSPHTTTSLYGTTSTSTNVNFFSGSYWVFIAVSVLINLIIGPALVLTQIKSAQGVKIGATQALKEGLRYIWRFIGLIICLYVVIAIGFVLLIVPGVFLLKRFLMSPYAMFRDKLGVIASMKQSAKLSKQPGAVWGLMGVFLLLSLLSLIPVLGWIVGFVGYIAYSCAIAIRYEQLSSSAALTEPSAPITNPVPPSVNQAI